MIKLKSLIQETTDKSAVKSRLQIKNLEDIQVGKTKLQAYPVDYNLLYKEMSTPSKKNMDALISKGCDVKKAYVMFQMQSNWGKQNEIMTWVIYMIDYLGKSIIYYKYEGPTAGAGQSYIYQDSKKIYLSKYLTSGLRDAEKNREEGLQEILDSFNLKVKLIARCNYIDKPAFDFTFKIIPPYNINLSKEDVIDTYDILEANYEKLSEFFEMSTNIEHLCGYFTYSIDDYTLTLCPTRDYNDYYTFIESFTLND